MVNRSNVHWINRLQKRGTLLKMVFDEKGKNLHGRVEFFEQNVRELSKYMSAVVGEHNRGVSSSLGFTERLRVVAAQEPFADLQDRMVGLAEFTEKVCEERQRVMCERAELNVVNKLDEGEVFSRLLLHTL